MGYLYLLPIARNKERSAVSATADISLQGCSEDSDSEAGKVA